MTISSKLMSIVILTIFEISLTICSVFEISKGAELHQLNFLHLKYSSEFSNRILPVNTPSDINVDELEEIILNIRQQPIACLNNVNVLNTFIMKQIGTYNIVEICETDIDVTYQAIDIISKLNNQKFDNQLLLLELKEIANTFNRNSALFEKPVKQTVAFIMKTMIPLVIFISCFNILLIVYMSRTISGSIKKTINLLKNKNNEESLAENINNNVSGELKTLLEVAQERIANDVMMAEVNNKLEKLVEQRTESLTRANSELSQFAYRTSHDLKAPLTTSKLLTGFIIEDIQAGDVDNAIKDINRIHEQMEKLENLVMNILSLTEADSLQENYSIINFDLLLDDIQERLSGLAVKSDYTIIKDIPLDIKIFTDKVRLTQVLENLISNALKYKDDTKSDLPFVKVIVTDSGELYEITVEDNGMGIPEDRHSEVFQMFKRFHPKHSFGSGLGLAIVKKHVDYLDGTIVMKTSNKGTIFSITIPKVIAT